MSICRVCRVAPLVYGLSTHGRTGSILKSLVQHVAPLTDSHSNLSTSNQIGQDNSYPADSEVFNIFMTGPIADDILDS